MLGHLSAEQRAPGRSAALRDTEDDLVDLLGHELPDRDVVEEEQRLGAAGRDVVDAHGHDVETDRVEATDLGGDEALRADTVGRRDEQRLPVREPAEGEEAAEPTDVADDLRAERRPDVLLDQLDGLLAGRDVDTRVGVGELLRLLAPRAHTQGRASGAVSSISVSARQPSRAPASSGLDGRRRTGVVAAPTKRDGSSSASFESASSGTGTG